MNEFMEVILHGDNVGAIIFGLTGALLTIVAKVCPYESASTSDLPYIAKQAVHSNESPVPEQIAFECERLGTDVMRSRARAFLALQNQRRSIRFMSQESFPLDILLSCIATGGCAPSGAHQQPWHFSVVSSRDLKAKIRAAVEEEEQVNYDRRMKQSWKDDLAPIFKNSTLHQDGVIEKPYLTDSPYVVIVSEVLHSIDPVTGEKRTHHYPKESVGIAVGMFLAALTNVGLFTLTSTPMNAGSAILNHLGRPSNERLFLLMPIGFPAKDCVVPYRRDGSNSSSSSSSSSNSSNEINNSSTLLRKHVKDIFTLYE